MAGSLPDIDKVNSGRGTSKQVIHADRMRPCPEQILRGEISFSSKPEVVGEKCTEIERERSENESLIETPDLDLDDASEIQADRQRRHRKPSAWLSDYMIGNKRW